MSQHDNEFPDFDLSEVPDIEAYLVTESRCESYKKLMAELSIEFCHSPGSHPFRLKCTNKSLSIKQKALNLFLLGSILVCRENTPVYLFEVCELSLELRQIPQSPRRKTQVPVPLAKALALTPKIQLYLKHCDMNLRCLDSNLLLEPDELRKCWGPSASVLSARAA